MLDVSRPVNREESYEGESKCIATTSKILIQCLGYSLPLRIKIVRWEGGGAGGSELDSQQQEEPSLEVLSWKAGQEDPSLEADEV